MNNLNILLKKSENEISINKNANRRSPHRKTASQQLVSQEITHQTEQKSFMLKNTKEWNVIQVGEWISYIGFKEFADNFVKFGINGDELLSLSEKDLSENLKIELLGSRKKIYSHIQSLKESL